MDETKPLHELSLDERLHRPGPKRILALDGGGVRGAISLEFLARIERELAALAPEPDAFRLSHYFDLIAGTSTGAISAACLSLGMRVEEIASRYVRITRDVFRRPFGRLGVFGAKFDSQQLLRHLREAFPPKVRMGDVGTGLLIMTKRFDTTSPWPLHNNPRGQYHQVDPTSGSICNLHYDLAEAVRASTAAPHYFAPQRIVLAREKAGDEVREVEGWFVDGGVSVMNNPALQAYMLATLDGYRLRWPTGKDQLLLVSAGTGRPVPKRERSRVALKHALQSLMSVMEDCSAHIETMLQWMSDCPTARSIDGEIGDMSADWMCGSAGQGRALLTYLRYDVELSGAWLRERLGGAYTDEFAARMTLMDRPEHVPELVELGKRAAERTMWADGKLREHFPACFDPPGW